MFVSNFMYFFLIWFLGSLVNNVPKISVSKFLSYWDGWIGLHLYGSQLVKSILTFYRSSCRVWHSNKAIRGQIIYVFEVGDWVFITVKWHSRLLNQMNMHQNLQRWRWEELKNLQSQCQHELKTFQMLKQYWCLSCCHCCIRHIPRHKVSIYT